MATKRVHRQALAYGPVQTVPELGRLVRNHRKGLHQVTLTRIATVSGVGPRFISELERGKDTAELGKALHVIQQLGLEVWLVPRGVAPGSLSGGAAVQSFSGAGL
ncbi:MAG: helix-turn-helix domain-containing protein [Gammaproteobacteria bacterium]